MARVLVVPSFGMMAVTPNRTVVMHYKRATLDIPSKVVECLLGRDLNLLAPEISRAILFAPLTGGEAGKTSEDTLECVAVTVFTRVCEMVVAIADGDVSMQADGVRGGCL